MSTRDDNIIKRRESVFTSWYQLQEWSEMYSQWDNVDAPIPTTNENALQRVHENYADSCSRHPNRRYRVILCTETRIT